jgi:hypothetical protein
MAQLQGTTVTGDLAVTGATSGQGVVPLGSIFAVISALSGSHTIPNTGTVDADGWQYCDGAVIPSSQTLSGTTPDLTDGRFLRGYTSSSGCGGAATFTLGLGNLAAHDHGGATTSASTTPAATGACGQTTASTTPGAGSACSATTGACGSTTGTHSANHTHTFTTGGQSCQHCHCICDGGAHNHAYCKPNMCVFCSKAGGMYRNCGQHSAGTDSRHHCMEHTCCTLSAVTHVHSGTTAAISANHTHSVPSHTHTVASHTHTGAAHTHTTPSHTHTSAAHTHATTIASAGSGTAKEHLPIYFNVKYLIRVI